MEVGIGLGSNLGERLEALRSGVRAVGALPAVRILAVSPVYETEPVDVPAAFRHLPYLNAALAVACAASLPRLAADLRAIEEALGRVRGSERNAPRALDLDLIYAGEVVLQTAELTLPHPRWAARRFVVAPLADIRPTLIVPGQRRSVSAILAGLPERPAARLYATAGWHEVPAKGTER
jgi:2-amino-4-hydroxy-6-hydroxymethyldihydropteridine diphosphokinase